MVLGKVYGILNSMNYSITVCALVSAFQCFVHLPTLLPSGSTRAAALAEKCGLSIWEWDCLICFLDRGHLVSWDCLQTEFMKLKLGEMGNLMTLILICCFSGFTLSFSVIGSVTNLTSSYWLLQLYVSCFLQPVFTQQQGINFEVKLLICLLFYNESHEFSPYVSPQSLHIPCACTAGNKTFGKVFPIVCLHPDTFWSSCSLLLIPPSIFKFEGNSQKFFWLVEIYTKLLRMHVQA